MVSQVQATEDHYATLGVAPRSEAAEIRAAYHALMRRFHPDRNDSPEAIGRAHAIIAAFAVLGNVEKRLHYDWARRRAADAAALSQRRWPVGVPKALLATVLVLVVAVPFAFLVPRPDSPPLVERAVTKVAENDPVPATPEAIVAPPSVGEVMDIVPQPAVSVEPEPAEASPTAEPVRVTDEAPLRVPPAPQIAPRGQRRMKNEPVPTRSSARAKPECRTANPGAEAAVCNNENLAALDRNVVTFYNQSLQFGEVMKRGPLLDARIGFLLRREECASDACLQQVHLDHLRELAAIVEKRGPGPSR